MCTITHSTPAVNGSPKPTEAAIAGPYPNTDNCVCYGAHPRTPLHPGVWFSLEFRTRTAVPEWNGELVSMQREEDMIIPASGPARYTAGPQDNLWIIK